MLGQRIVTAVVLLALLVPALLSGQPWPFPTLTVVLLAAAGWEWGRLHGGGQAWAWALAAVLLIACAVGGPMAVNRQVPREVWLGLSMGWLFVGSWSLRRGVEAWRHHHRLLTWALGLVMLWGAWMALVAAHAQGVAFVLSILCLVWMADIAAYFGGHAFGRRKLAPSISPGKSWEGVWSGMGAVLVLAWAWVSLIGEAGSPSLFSVLFDRFGWMWGSVMLLLLSGVSVVGDLFESLVKRAAGAKDSSRLLPGHGGVLDRIDALLPVFPLALALCAS